jgi:hypothetical protein
LLETISNLLQATLALGPLNAWVLRCNRVTAYRGGSSLTLWEEFLFYGLSSWFCYFIGMLKVGSAVLLIAGIWTPQVILLVSILVSSLMIAAILIKSLPALTMFILGGSIVYIRIS